jgi:ribosomal protein S10
MENQAIRIRLKAFDYRLIDASTRLRKKKNQEIKILENKEKVNI